MTARSALAKPDPVRVHIAFGVESVTVDFDRNGFTTRWQDRLQSCVDANDLVGAADVMREIIIAWDLVEDDGAPTPLSGDVLADLPIVFVSRLGEALRDAAIPASDEGNVSSVISSLPNTDYSVTPEPRRDGQTISRSPTDSESRSPT